MERFECSIFKLIIMGKHIEVLVKDLGKGESLTIHLKKVQKIIDFLESIHNDALLIGFEQGEKSNTLKL